MTFWEFVNNNNVLIFFIFATFCITVVGILKAVNIYKHGWPPVIDYYEEDTIGWDGYD